ncbi:four-carbon acid sugar kinase family protein [Microlunatus elymi]|uniref:Four-carbon acid sugar kinase family protein n=1 Tax=Microlunatus elymi TaxID=2596828 RepID=A0A516PXX0_9ACTN|nr:four-carbon acid sugar kinase family protein [Microlunatus elymi]QDP96024.1 four-carbon acid sugar kinase family protein [Microlunatus elymi]
MPRFAFYGDDFTGSVDVLLQFRRAGLSGVLATSAAVELPTDGHDVVGIAGTARSLPTDKMAAEALPALSRLHRLQPDLIQYKACSTVDSSPEIGSLGQVLELGTRLFGAGPIPLVFAQPDFGRYTFFGHHFARDGAEVFRLDRQPTMINHPVTPATESDLRLFLGRQTKLPIGLLPWTAYDQPDTVAAALSGPEAGMLCDAFTDQQLDLLARTIMDRGAAPAFVIGSGGISAALGRTATPPRTATMPPLPTTAEPADGPILVLSGSTSARTQQQVATSGWPRLDLFDDDALRRTLDLQSDGADVIVSSTESSKTVAAEEIPDRLAEIGDAWLRRADHGRVIICGGDTSGRVLRRLGVNTLSVAAQPWGNVCLCHGDGQEQHLSRTEFVLKGGQMGEADLFTKIKTGGSVNAASATSKSSCSERQ